MSNQSAAALPPWLREDHLEEAPLKYPAGMPASQGSSSHLASQTTGAAVPTTQKTPEQEKRAAMIHWSLRIITMVLCVLMCATAVIGVGKSFLSQSSLLKS